MNVHSYDNQLIKKMHITIERDSQVPTELMNELIASLVKDAMVFLAIFTAASLPMMYFRKTKKYGWALLYLPVYMLVIWFAMLNIFAD